LAKIAAVLETLNKIIAAHPNTQWTVRQFYYQLVSRGIIPNTYSSYVGFDVQLTRLRERGEISDAIIVDSSRSATGGDNSDWEPGEFVEYVLTDLGSKADRYTVSMWEDQPCKIIVVLEKDALSRIVQEVTDNYLVKLVVGRGYSSRTQMLQVVQELDGDNTILYLGDHDPTGLDIERSLEERITEEGQYAEVRRVALTYEQAKNLPPNPTKGSDLRAPNYVAQYGNKCWELDALEPEHLQKLVREEIEGIIDWQQWNEDIDRQAEARAQLDIIFKRVQKYAVRATKSDFKAPRPSKKKARKKTKYIPKDMDKFVAAEMAKMTKGIRLAGLDPDKFFRNMSERKGG
jgi:hypothetical protein